MGRMWMGTRGYEQWVPDCQISPDFSRVGASSSSNYLNGGRKIVRSKAGSKQYVMTWNMKHRDDLRFISDLADGIYDPNDGVNLVYFLDPMAMEFNVLSQMYASPMQGAQDGISWLPDRDPTLVPTPRGELLYPARSAVYDLKDTDLSTKLYIPIPPGYVAWIGAHGSASNAGLRFATVSADGNAGPVNSVTMLTTSDITRVNTLVEASDDVIGIELDIGTREAITTSYAWSGTVDNSPSRMLRNGRITATNWVANPRLNTTAGTIQTPDGVRPAVDGVVATNAVAWQDGEHALSGGKSLKIAWPGTPPVGLGFSPLGTSALGGGQ